MRYLIFFFENRVNDRVQELTFVLRTPLSETNFFILQNFKNFHDRVVSPPVFRFRQNCGIIKLVSEYPEATSYSNIETFW